MKRVANLTPHFHPCGPVSLFRNTTEAQFVIRHYAGAVIYTCEHFLKRIKIRSISMSTSHRALPVEWSRVSFLLKMAHDGVGEALVELPPSHRQVKARTASRPASRRSTALQATVAIKFKAQPCSLKPLIRRSHDSSDVNKTNHELKPRLVDRIAVSALCWCHCSPRDATLAFLAECCTMTFFSIHVLLEPPCVKGSARKCM